MFRTLAETEEFVDLAAVLARRLARLLVVARPVSYIPTARRRTLANVLVMDLGPMHALALIPDALIAVVASPTFLAVGALTLSS